MFSRHPKDTGEDARWRDSRPSSGFHLPAISVPETDDDDEDDDAPHLVEPDFNVRCTNVKVFAIPKSFFEKCWCYFELDNCLFKSHRRRSKMANFEMRIDRERVDSKYVYIWVILNNSRNY